MDETIFDMIKKIRLEAGFTQKDVANLLNISRSTYTKYETGDLQPGFNILCKLASIYDISVDSFCPPPARDESTNNVLKDSIAREKTERLLISYYRLIPKSSRKEILEIFKKYADEHASFSDDETFRQLKHSI